jgi:hypothetical protein
MEEGWGEGKICPADLCVPKFPSKFAEANRTAGNVQSLHLTFPPPGIFFGSGRFPAAFFLIWSVRIIKKFSPRALS